VRPRNPRTPEQQSHRSNLRAVLRRWRTLTPEQRAAWCIATANKYFVTETGRQVRFNGYNFVASLNTRRADLDLAQFDLPPTDGWSDITELYVARHGVPKTGTSIWIRTCQHIDGWTDAPRVTRARVPAAAA